MSNKGPGSRVQGQDSGKLILTLDTSAARGFTLLEVIVSIAVLGIAIAMASQLFSRSLLDVTVIGEQTIAISHADGIMNELLVDDSIRDNGELSGHFEDGYRWRAVVEEVIELPTAEEQLQQLKEPPAKKLNVSVIVFWAKGSKENFLRLDTIKLVENERFQSTGGGAFRQPPTGAPSPTGPPLR